MKTSIRIGLALLLLGALVCLGYVIYLKISLNSVDAALPAHSEQAKIGRTLYHQYGCFSCHGKTGEGVGDLTLAKIHFTNDVELRAWIEDPRSVRGDARMPPFKGVIKEKDYAPLIAYVRELGEQKPKAPSALKP